MSLCYQSDIRALSDDELHALSEELSDAYCRSGYEESYWTDDEAENRYYEMSREIRRRWELANPEDAERQRNDPFNIAMRRMSLQLLELTAGITAKMRKEARGDATFAGGTRWSEKIGDVIPVRKPQRFTGTTGA